MTSCAECRSLELAVQDAHNARIEARARFQDALHVPAARELAERYREASDAYHQAAASFRLHRESHGHR